MKIELLADSWTRRTKNEDGEVEFVRYVKGDVIDVTDKEAKKLLNDEGPRTCAKKHVEEKAPAAEQKAPAANSTKS